MNDGSGAAMGADNLTPYAYTPAACSVFASAPCPAGSIRAVCSALGVTYHPAPSLPLVVGLRGIVILLTRLRDRTFVLGRETTVKRAILAVTLLLTGCVAIGHEGISGRYMTAPGYGFEFVDGGTVYSLSGDRMGRGTYTIDGERVIVCFVAGCNDLTLRGDCLLENVDVPGRYCKENP